MKILFHNIWNMNPKLLSAIRYLKSQSPDVLVIAELPKKRLEAVSEILHEYPYQVVVAPNKVGSLAVYSKHEISNFSELDEGDFAGRPQGIMDIDVLGKGSFRLIAIHTAAPLTIKKYKRRNRQLLALSDVIQLEQTQCKPVIIVGDFNTSHRRKELKDLRTRNNLSEPRLGKRTHASWPMYGRFWCIDHMFCSEHFEIENFQLLRSAWSDHRAISAEFILR
ncbi:endonuclease/exonuclease/phosphatase family protein [Akkermansiaceae bacterium]|nr:endonuclease/exonuclease/phosphatase family protein [Akkermansiaceae bacterium]